MIGALAVSASAAPATDTPTTATTVDKSTRPLLATESPRGYSDCIAATAS
jgi:hypothetical protein